MSVINIFLFTIRKGFNFQGGHVNAAKLQTTSCEIQFIFKLKYTTQHALLSFLVKNHMLLVATSCTEAIRCHILSSVIRAVATPSKMTVRQEHYVADIV